MKQPIRKSRAGSTAVIENGHGTASGVASSSRLAVARAHYVVTGVRPWSYSTLTTVIQPDPSDPLAVFSYAWSGDDKLLIKVVFSGPMDASSAVARLNVVLRTSGDANADMALQWSPDATTMLLKTVKSSGDLLRPRPDDSFTLTLVGDDIRVGLLVKRGLRDEFGLRLDGDRDGREGGNYVMSFTVIG